MYMESQNCRMSFLTPPGRLASHSRLGLLKWAVVAGSEVGICAGSREGKMEYSIPLGDLGFEQAENGTQYQLWAIRTVVVMGVVLGPLFAKLTWRD